MRGILQLAVLMFAVALVIAGMGLAQSRQSVPALVIMDVTDIQTAYEAGLRSHASGLEEFYCLTGQIDKQNRYHIESMVAVRQSPGRVTDGRRQIAYVVRTEPCPKKTIADLHTHPFVGAIMPSAEDDESARDESSYKLHLIVFPGPKNLVGMSAWYYSRSERINLTGEWLGMAAEYR